MSRPTHSPPASRHDIPCVILLEQVVQIPGGVGGKPGLVPSAPSAPTDWRPSPPERQTDQAERQTDQTQRWIDQATHLCFTLVTTFMICGNSIFLQQEHDLLLTKVAQQVLRCGVRERTKFSQHRAVAVRIGLQFLVSPCPYCVYCLRVYYLASSSNITVHGSHLRSGYVSEFAVCLGG